MGLLDKLWDDVVAGPQPEKGLGKLRQKQAGLSESFDIDESMMDRRRSSEFQQRENEARRISQSISIKKPSALQATFDPSDSPVASPTTSSPMAASPGASPAGREKDNVWRSVFHPGQNRALKKMGSAKFDNVTTPNSPTVYDWLYSSKSKSEWR